MSATERPLGRSTLNMKANGRAIIASMPKEIDKIREDLATPSRRIRRVSRNV